MPNNVGTGPQIQSVDPPKRETIGSAANSNGNTWQAQTDSDRIPEKLSNTTPTQLKNGTTAGFTFRGELPKAPTVVGAPTQYTPHSHDQGEIENQLTPDERNQIEYESRIVASRALVDAGYHVELMPLDNPGYDLKATRPGEELRVEVKGHRGGSYVAQVSDAQIRESEQCMASEGRRCWELWNVEHLAASDPNPVSITVVTEIPAHARKADRYRVDLRLCEIVRRTSM